MAHLRRSEPNRACAMLACHDLLAKYNRVQDKFQIYTEFKFEFQFYTLLFKIHVDFFMRPFPLFVIGFMG
jgi:hypothetical protein